MKLPRDISGQELTKALLKLGYEPTRQTGSHVHILKITHHKFIKDKLGDRACSNGGGIYHDFGWQLNTYFYYKFFKASLFFRIFKPKCKFFGAKNG